MSIEVREMVVKTTVVQSSDSRLPKNRRDPPPLSADDMHKIFDAVRRLVQQTQEEKRER